jgi:hypothetical protein
MSHYLKIGNNILKNSDHGIQQAFVDSLSRMTSNNHPNTMQNVNRAFQNPESIPEILQNKLEHFSTAALPPDVRVGIKLVEKIIKPALDLGAAIEP